ncbi:MAG: hypothetical protein NVS3B17_17250 [Vulcanimicrobiaceae bacterium]
MQSTFTRANRMLSHHRFSRSIGGPLVRVVATVSEIFPSPGFHHGANHQHLVIAVESVESIGGMPQARKVDDSMFVAIRFGDDAGLADSVPFEVGARARVQGEYVDAMAAYPTQDNPGLAVLHFTHHPAGFVQYPLDANGQGGEFFS